MAATQNFPPESTSYISNRQETGLNGLTDNNLLRDRMGLEEELRNRMGLNNGIEEELRNRMGLNNSIGEELRTRMGLNNGLDQELRSRMGLNNGMAEELRNRIAGTNSIEEELRNRMGTMSNIEEELRNRMGGTNSIEEEIRSRMGGTNSIEEEIRSRMGGSNNIDEELRSRMGGTNSIEEELRSRMGGTNNIEEELRSRMGLSSGMVEEIRNRMGLNSSVEEELRSRMGLNNQLEQSVQNRMAFYNSIETMRQQNQTFDETFQPKNGDSHLIEKDKCTEPPNSDHLDETIEAVARNQFDYEPVIKPEIRNSCNQFMDHFPIKQEPIDYDLMAANLTAGLMNPDRRHMCAHCCKGFRSRQQLLQHSLVHSNLRKYHCNYCERSFKQLSHLHQHHRIHTGEKPYSCPLDGCDKAFPQLSNLQHHIRNHDKLAESQYQCHLCDRSYPNEATLKAHNTRMHVHSKLIPNLQKSPLSQPHQSVSQIPIVSDMQPRQRKRKATRPQHINNRSVIPFSQSRSEMENRMFSHLVNRQGKDGQDNFVYVLDSDEDNSRDIPIKKPEIASNNNNFYSHNLSQKENFYNTDRLEESQSKNMTMSDNADNFFRGNNNSSSVHNSNSNFRYGNDIAYRPQTSDVRSHGLPKLSNELPRNNNHVSVSSNEMFRNNNHVRVSSNEMHGHKNPMAISSNGMSQNNNFLPVSSSDIPRTKPVSVPSNGIAVSSSHMTMAANQMQRDNIQRSQLSNEMQRYTDGVGLDLSINNHDFSRLYEERSRLSNMMSNNTYASSHIPRITNGLSDNRRMMDNKQNQNLPNDIMPDNRNSFNQMMNETINNWQRRSYVHQKRMDNEESDESSDESESEMDRHHFQTPNLGTDVYDDPMN